MVESLHCAASDIKCWGGVIYINRIIIISVSLTVQAFDELFSWGATYTRHHAENFIGFDEA
jgi:hypothetical protein